MSHGNGLSGSRLLLINKSDVDDYGDGADGIIRVMMKTVEDCCCS